MKPETGKVNRRILLLIAVMSLGMAFPAMAMGPGDEAEIGQEAYAKLSDDLAEWDEIEDLVKLYNPTYRKYAGSAEGTVTELSSAAADFSEEMDESIQTIDDSLKELKKQREALAGLPGEMVIDGNGTTVSQMLAALSATEENLKTTKTGIKKGVGKTTAMARDTAYSTKTALKQVWEPITKAVEGLFISYQQLKINEELVEEQIKLMETLLSTQESLYDRSMATEADVTAAKLSLSQAKESLATIRDGIVKLQTAIGLQLGWDASSPPVIGEVPDPEEEYVSKADREADFREALKNNKTYENTGKISNYTGVSAVMQRDDAVNEASAKAEAAFDLLYAEMLRQELLYEAAQTSLKLSELKKEQAKKLYEQGLTGNAEYKAGCMDYLASEANAKLARLSYTSAINDYRWAVRGYMDY